MAAGFGGSSHAGSHGQKLPPIGHPSETNHCKHQSVWTSSPTMAQQDGAPWCWLHRQWQEPGTVAPPPHQSVSLSHDPLPIVPLYLTRLPVARVRSKWLSREETKTTTSKTRQISRVCAMAKARNVTLNAQLGRPHQLEGVEPAAVPNHQPLDFRITKSLFRKLPTPDPFIMLWSRIPISDCLTEFPLKKKRWRFFTCHHQTKKNTSFCSLSPEKFCDWWLVDQSISNWGWFYLVLRMATTTYLKPPTDSRQDIPECPHIFQRVIPKLLVVKSRSMFNPNAARMKSLLFILQVCTKVDVNSKALTILAKMIDMSGRCFF